MSININDLNECFEINTSSPFSDRDSLKDLRELSPEELKISGGAGHYLGHHRTVVIADDDLDVYFIDNSVPTDFIYNADLAEIIPGKRINFDDGSVTMRRNGDIDVTFSDSDSDSSTS